MHWIAIRCIRNPALDYSTIVVPERSPGGLLISTPALRYGTFSERVSREWSVDVQSHITDVTHIVATEWKTQIVRT